MKNFKERVWKANLQLEESGLVTLTFGNVSGFDPEKGLIAIKPSGVAYKNIKASDMVILDLEGRRIEGVLNPSSDTPTHLALYRAFPSLRGIAHSHSHYAAVFSQAGLSIPCLGTTHADHFLGEIPLTRWITPEEVDEDYEGNTGKVIVERFRGLDPVDMPAVLVAGHGPFVWGGSPEEAVLNSIALEAVAEMAWATLKLKPGTPSLPEYLLKKHFQRKHGPNAYYGQEPKGEE